HEFQKPYHIILLAKNQTGLENLYKLVSLSHTEYFFRTPRLPRHLIKQYHEGLLIGSACESGELFRAIVRGTDHARLESIASFYDYLEIQPLGNNEFMIRAGEASSREELADFNKQIVKLGQRLGKAVVATGDVHFINPEDEVYRRIIQSGQGYEGSDAQAPLYMRTTAEMLAEFDYLTPEEQRWVVIDCPNRIVDAIEDIKPVPDEFCPPIIEGSDEEIRQMAYDRAVQLYGDPLPAIVSDRIEWELQSIIGHGYAVLYLIAHKLVKKSLDDGYLVGSRGSVGSSLIATLCGITEVNPLPAHYLCEDCHYSEFMESGSIGSGVDLPDKDCPKCGQPLKKDGHDIHFATFMGFEGDKEPDIDLNFSGEYQPVVHRYTEELFGKDYVFRAGTITTLAEKTAFGFVKAYLEEHGTHARRAQINRLVKGCTGVKRSTGQHPGGMMVVPPNRNIHQFSPVQYPANDKNAGWITT
ncbi:MAG TPA: PolC-type DNA polymerase III, partial [Firmicutes bacterium]|nr:PolC-type DNA polymerase III [Bacillota bacterium]